MEAWLGKEIAADLELPDPLPPHVELSRYRIDSVTAASVLGSLSQWIGWAVPPHLVFDQPTIASIARLVADARPSTPSSRRATPSSRQRSHAARLVALRAPVPPRPVFCVGGMTGAALYLRPLADALGEHQPFFAFQAPGLDGKAPPLDSSVSALADLYLEELLATQPDGPYTLAGHSFGGLVAYAMAGRLHARGQRVRRVILLDTMLFGEGEPSHPPDEESAVTELLIAVRLKEQPDRAPDLTALQRMPLGAQRAEVMSFIAGPQAASETSLQRWVEVYRAHSRAMRDFRPDLPGALPVVLVKAADGYPRSLMLPSRERHGCYDAPLLGWERLDARAIEVVSTPGNHYTMVFGDHARTTAALLRPYLGR